ncbi:MAG: YdeI/OmpD-associated family protein [Bacteroidia bacterium]
MTANHPQLPTNFEAYLRSGCGRCDFYDSPQCKVHPWHDLLQACRAVLRDCGLEENIKWGVPCYTHQGKNIVLLGALREAVSLGFMKGALLADDSGLLQKPGPNAHESRLIRLKGLTMLEQHLSTIKSLVYQAVEVEKAGLVVPKQSVADIAFPAELQSMFEADPAFEAAFYALTPGRQKGYLFHFNQAKQSQTRSQRIQKYLPQIMQGIGLHDKYNSKKSEK